MKTYFRPTISESKDHLHMCLSEIAQARQVSPVCEIKLAAVFIDLSIQKKKKKEYRCSFLSVEHQVILDGFLLIFHLSHVWMTGQH